MDENTAQPAWRVAINGYGRIGQCLLRALVTGRHAGHFRVVAINELADLETISYLTRFDTTHGRFPLPISHGDDHLVVGQETIRVWHEADPARLSWDGRGIDLLFECSGSFSDRATAETYLKNGASRLLLSHPAGPDIDATIVFGVNNHLLRPQHRIVSAASCTTNCLTPILHILDRKFGVERGLVTTIHSAMNDQPVIDSYHNTNLRLTRSALHSIIPVDTGLAKGIERILPEMRDRFQCLHLRVPTINVSAMDVSVNLRQPTTVMMVNKLFREAATGAFAGLLAYTEEPQASVDFNTDPHSVIVDATQTRMVGEKMLKMLLWFDNEWGFANRMLDLGRLWLGLAGKSA
ncbi:MAG: erythrose-4-phosphate dehydrogenase [Desulfobulbaceae bacterium]|jgi:D-erythrose 4-phosphate dehydrogenase|nr:erythrose-4-phosphate dehydrogenase [Desulfobulbaceae bacterium]